MKKYYVKIKRKWGNTRVSYDKRISGIYCLEYLDGGVPPLFSVNKELINDIEKDIPSIKKYQILITYIICFVGFVLTFIVYKKYNVSDVIYGVIDTVEILIFITIYFFFRKKKRIIIIPLLLIESMVLILLFSRIIQ